MKLNDTLGAILHMLFPYRTHLEAEVLYLRSQLARADRRIEELEGRFNPVQAERRPPPKLPTLKRAFDWTTYKEMNKEQETEPVETKCTTDTYTKLHSNSPSSTRKY